MSKDPLMRIYRALFAAFGPQHWWPGETPFEVMVGAILTQNTNWGNVERAIQNLKAADRLDPRRLLECPEAELARLIRPSGYFNVKTRRLRAFLQWLSERDVPQPPPAVQLPHPTQARAVVLHEEEASGRLAGVPTAALRKELLDINGIGPETADSILLYALRRRVFVVDAYTRRFLSRHGLIRPDAPYEEIRALFERSLPPSVKLYNEYHALIVRLGKELCRPAPRCERCPLRTLLGPPQL